MMCVVIIVSVGILARAEPVQADRPLTETEPSVPESAPGDQKQYLAKGSLPIARHHLHWVDGVVVTTYALGMLGIGWYYNRRQQNVDEYFVGNRSMNSYLIGISLFATLFSTISYLSTPGELIGHGPVILTGMIGIPFSYLVVGHFMIPFYMRYQVTSAYELLEITLGVPVRITGAIMFIVLRLVWMSLLIFFASKAMIVMLGINDAWLPLVTFVTGAVAIVYASLGGLRAVVITDLMQFILLFGGAVMVLITVSVHLGGLNWIPTRWNPAWDVQPLFSINPEVRVTLVGSVFHGVVWWMCTAGSDQTAIQRFMATRDMYAARRSFLTNTIAGAMVSVVLALVGFALLAYFEAFPGALLEGTTIARDSDLLFPHFISHHLPVGISGLVVSGMFAAAMSSLDSGVNSITAVVMTDFIERFGKRKISSRSRIRVAQRLALLIGLIVVLTSSVMEYIPGNFLEISKRTIGLFVAPLFVLFAMSIFVPFATSQATILATLVSFISAFLVAYWGTFSGTSEVSFQWILPVSLLTGLAGGCLFSLMHRQLNIIFHQRTGSG